MPTPDNFHIFSLLPPEARVHIVLGGGGSYWRVSSKPAQVEAEIRAAVADLYRSIESYIEHGIVRAENRERQQRQARSIYTRDEEARIEFSEGDLEGLELRIWCGDKDTLQGHVSPDVLTDPWVFVGARYEMPYCRPKDGPARIEKVVAFLMTLPFAENELW